MNTSLDKKTFERVMNTYPNLDVYYRNILRGIFGFQSDTLIQCYYSKDIIKFDEANTLKGVLDNLNNKCGIYIFLNKFNSPVYIGVAGEKNSKHSLYDRLQKQFNCGERNGTLSKNIVEIKQLLQNKQFNASSKDEYKQFILDYAPKLLVIPLGSISNENNKFNALNLEKILIAVLNSKYNK
jgi:hypothetical protein